MMVGFIPYLLLHTCFITVRVYNLYLVLDGYIRPLQTVYKSLKMYYSVYKTEI